jgi:hypothetical protein
VTHSTAVTLGGLARAGSAIVATTALLDLKELDRVASKDDNQMTNRTVKLSVLGNFVKSEFTVVTAGQGDTVLYGLYDPDKHELLTQSLMRTFGAGWSVVDWRPTARSRSACTRVGSVGWGSGRS